MSVEYTDAPDMITLEADPQHRRFKMPYCGHAITAETLWNYYKKEISALRYPVQCPGYFGSTRCIELWDLDVIKRYVTLSSTEVKRLDEDIRKIKILHSPGKTGCPKCKSICERSDKKSLKITCRNCSGSNYSFCWSCLRDWKGADVTSCGNNQCPGIVDNLQRLKTASKKTIGEVDKCPSLRACPHCGFVIEHGGDCKHMMCPNCHQKFCFICLSVPDKKGYYPCGGYFTACPVAAIQTAI